MCLGGKVFNYFGSPITQQLYFKILNKIYKIALEAFSKIVGILLLKDSPDFYGSGLNEFYEMLSEENIKTTKLENSLQFSQNNSFDFSNIETYTLI